MHTISLTLALTAALAATACKKDEPAPAPAPAAMEPKAAEPKAATPAPAANTIVDVAAAAGSFKTLLAAVEAAGLVETLKGDGPFTVFAPTDDAFAKIPKADLDALLADKARLTAVLTYHVVPGKVMAKDITGMTSAKTVNGAEVPIDTRAGVKVDGATVTQADIEASNGVIHVIDTVIVPRTKS